MLEGRIGIQRTQQPVVPLYLCTWSHAVSLGQVALDNTQPACAGKGHHGGHLRPTTVPDVRRGSVSTAVSLSYIMAGSQHALSSFPQPFLYSPKIECFAYLLLGITRRYAIIPDKVIRGLNPDPDPIHIPPSARLSPDLDRLPKAEHCRQPRVPSTLSAIVIAIPA